MHSDKFTLIWKALGVLLPMLGMMHVRRVAAAYHSWTWQNIPNAKNIVVVGGSFAGIQLVKRLAETLPTGYKVVWVEKNSHLNYSFVFPRFSVMTGHEHMAFIPYDGVGWGALSGIITHIQDTAVKITQTQVLLASGQSIDYAYFAIATGSSQQLPVQVTSTERESACYELRTVQELIRANQKIAVVGGGAVGIQLSSDIKDFYPAKDVTLTHSRDHLLSPFGKRLQDYALDALQNELKVRVLLNERPKMPVQGNLATSAKLTFSDGREEEFDLVIGCTGQRRNSAILASLLPGAISRQTSRNLVQPTLQVLAKDADTGHKELPILAFGDVAEHRGPKMARAGFMQADVVVDNILNMISGRPCLRIYKPNIFVEGAIRLTLGKAYKVLYAMDGDGSNILIPEKNGTALDLGVKHAWDELGADSKLARGPPISERGANTNTSGY